MSTSSGIMGGSKLYLLSLGKILSNLFFAIGSFNWHDGLIEMLNFAQERNAQRGPAAGDLI
jgi:hypothetical protein